MEDHPIYTHVYIYIYVYVYGPASRGPRDGDGPYMYM